MIPMQAAVHSPDLERAVLGVLLDGRHVGAWATFVEVCVSPLAFFIRNHRIIALALDHLATAGTKIDAMAVIARLGLMPWNETWLALRTLETGKPAKVGATTADGFDSALAAVDGANGVLDLVAAQGSFSGFAENCRHLAAYHAQRQMVAALVEATEHANAVGASERVGEIVDQTIHRLAALVMVQEGTSTLSEAMRRVITRPRVSGEGPAALLPSWGIPALDRALPLRACRYVVLAAQPGHGKSSLGLQAATATAGELGHAAVGMVNLEMPAEQIGAILLGRAIRAPVKMIESGGLSDVEVQSAHERIAERAAADIYLRTASRRVGIDEICSWIRQRHVRSAGRLALVVIDYLQLIDGKGRQTEYDRVSEASRSLKLLANELRICLLVLSQLNRDGSKSERDRHGHAKGAPEPRLQDLRGSGSIEQDADAVVFIWPPQEVPEADLPVMLKIAKNRGGPTTSNGRHIDAVLERANGQVFRQVSAPSSLAREDSSRAHHAHPPSPAEDGWADRTLSEPA